MVIEHNAAFIIMHVPLELQVMASNSYLCHHHIASRISQLNHFEQPIIGETLWSGSLRFLAGGSEPSACFISPA